MTKVLMKGNEALGKAAILAGCRYYFGCPVSPQSDLPAYLAKQFPKVGGSFIQAESELSAISMVYGAAAAGARVLTSNSGPDVGAEQEGIAHIAAAELPAVIVNIMRGGPGLRPDNPSQGDYWKATRGHGGYRTIVFAPSSVQEMADFTIQAFDFADRFMNPVILLADGITDSMMEPVELPENSSCDLREKTWALGADRPEGSPRNICSTIMLNRQAQEDKNWRLYQKYRDISDYFSSNSDLAVEEYMCEDADIALVGYGIMARVLKTVVEKCRRRGIKAGLIRPKILWPFPAEAVAKVAEKVSFLVAIEMSYGQMVEDVKLAVNGKKPVYFFGRLGNTVPSDFEILHEVEMIIDPEKE